MRTIAFGYSNRCNIKCEHCVAADGNNEHNTMELAQAKDIIGKLASANVTGISFTAGEPLLFLDAICELLKLCQQHGIYSRIVSNSFWAKTPEDANRYIARLSACGLSQLRLSYSRWHQKNINRTNIVNAARSCEKNGVDYFVSHVTDFSEEDREFEDYLRKHKLIFFPEPVIFSGRAKSFDRTPLRTDYQANCCPMNPYIAPDYTMYACCDAGSHFTKTHFFRLGNVLEEDFKQLFLKSEQNPLYHYIRTLGISGIASFAGFSAREIIGYRKCELCEKLFNSPAMLEMLKEASQGSLATWKR